MNESSRKVEELTNELRKMKSTYKQSVREAAWRGMECIEEDLTCRICQHLYIVVSHDVLL